MNETTLSTTIEILGRFYSIRCNEDELSSLQAAANYLNQKMGETKETGKVGNLERIAIISALNIAHEFLELKEQKSNLVENVNQKITYLHSKLDKVINPDFEEYLSAEQG